MCEVQVCVLGIDHTPCVLGTLTHTVSVVDQDERICARNRSHTPCVLGILETNRINNCFSVPSMCTRNTSPTPMCTRNTSHTPNQRLIRMRVCLKH